MEPLSIFKREWNVISDPIALLGAVVRASDETDAAGQKPGAEIWESNRAYFLRHGRPRVVRHWLEWTGREHEEEFPWSDDHVVKTWTDWRKALDGLKKKTRELLGLQRELFTGS